MKNTIMPLSIAVILAALTLLWWILGATAGLNRGFDLTRTFIFIIAFLPLASTVVLSIIYIFGGHNLPRLSHPSTSIVLVALMLVFSLILLGSRTASTYGWIRDRVSLGSEQITEDGLLRYRLDLINTRQRNSRAELIIHCIATGNVSNININFTPDEINQLTGEGSDPRLQKRITLQGTEYQHLYIVETIQIWSFRPTIRFLVDVDGLSANRFIP